MLKSYIAFDLETTGLSPVENEIIEIGALKVREGKVVDRFMQFVCPTCSISSQITGITGITNEMVAAAPDIHHIIPAFLEFCEDDILIGHNVTFDYSFIKQYATKENMSFEKNGIDTLKIAKKVLTDLDSKSLGALCDHYHIENKSAHRAYHDALATAKLYQTLAHYFEESHPESFKPIPLMYKVKKPQPATDKQKSFIQKLIRQKKRKIEWNPETLTRNEASQIIDSLLNT